MAEQPAPVRSPFAEVCSATNKQAGLQYVPRGGPKTPPIDRRIKELQEQAWGNEKTLQLQPHRHRLEIEKDKAAQERDQEVVQSFVTAILRQACARYGQSYTNTLTQKHASTVQPANAAGAPMPTSSAEDQENSGNGSKLEREQLACRELANSCSTGKPKAVANGRAEAGPVAAEEEDAEAVVQRTGTRAAAAVLPLDENPWGLSQHRSRIQIEKEACQAGDAVTRDRSGAAARHALLWHSTGALGHGFRRPLSKLEQEQAAWDAAMREAP